VVTALARNYPDAARLLLSLETQDHQEVREKGKAGGKVVSG
jgi:hypothetical protein